MKTNDTSNNGTPFPRLLIAKEGGANEFQEFASAKKLIVEPTAGYLHVISPTGDEAWYQADVYALETTYRRLPHAPAFVH